jgi:hypothetical protein
VGDTSCLRFACAAARCALRGVDPFRFQSAELAFRGSLAVPRSLSVSVSASIGHAAMLSVVRLPSPDLSLSFSLCFNWACSEWIFP